MRKKEIEKKCCGKYLKRSDGRFCKICPLIIQPQASQSRA